MGQSCWSIFYILFPEGGDVVYQSYNPNPKHRRGVDCTVRAIAKVTGKTWDEVYTCLCLFGFIEKDMPSSNLVWGAYLRNQGFTRSAIPNTCPDCYTVSSFAEDHPTGSYVLALPGHVVAVVSGDYYDTFDSGDETPIFYWTKEE